MPDKFRLMLDSSAKSKEQISEELKRLIELKKQPAERPAQAERTEEKREQISGAVRDAVRERISSIVREAVQSAKEDGQSYGERIPPRRDNVEYLAEKHTVTADELAYAPSEFEPEDDGAAIRARIAEMRRLGQTFYNGYMLRQCAEETLVKQGEYMKDVTDDFGRNCFCGIDRPIYGAMSADQLRTYFTWRTSARRSVYNRTDKPYVLLYCYELLNKIGVMSSADAYNRLSEVWERCREFCPQLNGLLPRWLKDFRAFNELGDNVTICPGEELSGAETGQDRADILAKKYSGKLAYLLENSGYNLVGSIFYNEQTAGMFDRVLEPVLAALDGWFAEYGVTMFELLCGRLKKDFAWEPFSGAYVDRDRMDGFHSLRISPVEQYCVKRGQPCLEVFEPAPYRNFIGWVLKSVESVLRKRTGFRYGITPNITVVLEDLANRERLLRAANAEGFQQVIPQAVEKWCDENGIFPPKKQKKRPGAYNYDEEPKPGAKPDKPVPVEIDISKLAKIREESDETTRKLIIEEPDTIQQEEITDRIASIEEDSFEEQAAGFARYNSGGSGERGEAETSGGAAGSKSIDTSGLPEGWREFAEGLTEDDLELLRALVGGTAEALCRSRGKMPETEYDRINSAAMENIGDVLIENGEIIPDYLPDTENMINRAK